VCGISGWVAPPKEALDPLVARRMRDVLRHRGPDGEGEWSAASGDAGMAAGLGHRRLRIIDLTDAAAQPMVSDDGLIALTYNGEIYNFRALRDELRAAGATFRSSGDTEVVLRAYERWGEAAVERLDGMFAFAVWDARTERLLLARDRTGKKPLFYWTDGRRLAFGSEIKSVLACPWVDRRLDESRLPEFLTFGYVPNPATLYEGIHQVPPASVLSFGRDGLSAPRRYWDPLTVRSPDGHGPLHADVRRLLQDAVARRMVADVPLGALLSGGIDSSLVVALMSRLSAEPIHTFAIGFADDASFDERRYARTVAERFGTRHTEFSVELDAVGLLDRLLWHHDQPYMDSSAIPTYVVSQLASEHVVVALNGDGGDEVFGGYDRFRAAALSVRLPRAVAAAARAAASRLPVDHSYNSPGRRVQRFLERADRPVESRYQSWIAVADEDLLGSLLSPDVLAAAAGPVLESMDARYRHADRLPVLDRILYANFMTYLPDDLAVKMDRMSMANSLETRSPFLDTALVERLAAVPARQKVGKRRLKPVLRRAFWDELPPEIWNRDKHGFGVPMGTWFRGPLGEMFEDEVLAPGARVAPLLQGATLARLYTEHRDGRGEHGARLWTVLTLERWLRTLERPLDAEPPDPRLELGPART
jgi:asparagine synthase (glutamine-hydrolysing)